MLLNNIAQFLQIIEKGSLTAAGRDAHFGVLLLKRTTRALSLTAEGRTLLDGAKQLLGEVNALESRIRLGAQTLSGPIRVSALRGQGGRRRVVCAATHPAANAVPPAGRNPGGCRHRPSNGPRVCSARTPAAPPPAPT